MKKELRFSASIDTAAFDRAVESMQKRLSKVYEATDRSRMSVQTRDRLADAGLGAPSSPTDRIRADVAEKQARREMDTFIKQQVREQEQINRKLNERLDLARKLNAEMKKIGSDETKSAEIRERVLRTEKEIGQYRAQANAKDAAINYALDQRAGMGGGPGGFGRLQNAYQMGGMGGAARAAGRMLTPGIALSGASAVLGGIAELTQYFGQLPRGVLSAQGTATANTSGQMVRDLFSGRASENLFYGSERAEAMKIARRENVMQRAANDQRLLGAGLGLAGGIIGTAATGGMLPLIAGGAYGAYQLATNSQFRDRAMGVFSSDARNRYEAQLQAQQGQNFQQNFQNLKEIDPIKQATRDKYMQNLMPNLAMQRQLGITDNESDFMLRRGVESGFTMDMTRQASGGIMAAGGSSQAGRQLATLSNRLARDFDATNAPQMIGKLSGVMGSAATTENSTIRVMAEAVRIGFNRSEFAEENRRFTSLAADVIARSGANTFGEAESVMGGFSKFMQGSTMGDIQGGAQAYEIQQRLTSQSGGARGAIQAAFMASDPTLNKLSRDERSLFLNMSEEQIRAGGFEMEAAASKAGVGVEELKASLLKMKDQSISPRADVDSQRNKLRDMLTGKSPEEKKKIMQSKEFKDQLGSYGAGLSTTTEGYAQMSEQGRLAFAKAQVVGMEGLSEEEKALVSKEEGKIKDGKVSTRRGDAEIGAQAVGDQAYMESLKMFGGEIDNSTANLSKFKEALMKATDELTKAFKEKDIDKITSASKEMGNLMGSQPRSNTPGR